MSCVLYLEYCLYLVSLLFVSCSMQTSDFNYNLPKQLIAQKPASPRDFSRLMILDRYQKSISYHFFNELPQFLKKGDVLVFNDTEVIKACLKGEIGNSGKVEILLVRKFPNNSWQVMAKPGRKLISGGKIKFSELVEAKVMKVNEDGTRFIKFNISGDKFDGFLSESGIVPLPPYISNETAKLSDYQTIYAKNKGSCAAPTAGFHFTKRLFKALSKKGVQLEFVTLHVGMGTFQPVKVDNIKDHKMHSEYFSLTKEVAQRLNRAKREGRRIIGVGTTSVRVLESCVVGASRHGGAPLRLTAQTANTNLFIYPGYKWKFVDGIITNFHLPKSTLLMLVAAFCGKDFIFKAYKEAIKKKYRFYSFGDGMMIN